MNRNVGIAILVIIIAAEGYFVFRTAGAGPKIPEHALARERVLACGACGEVIETTEGDVMNRKLSEDRQFKCDKCGEWQLRGAWKCPACGEWIPVPRRRAEEAGTPAPRGIRTECAKCGADIVFG